MCRTEFDCEDLNCKFIFWTCKVLKSNVYLTMYLHNTQLITPVLQSKPENTMYYYTIKPWPTVACYIDLKETPAWCILPWVLISRMESVVALWTSHSWWLPWQEIIMCIIYASSCTTPILHTLITHMHAYIAQPIYRTHIHTYIHYTLYHTHIHYIHAYNHAYIPCIHPVHTPCIYAYKHTWIQMSDYYSWPQSSSVSNESSGTRIFQRTVSAQVRPAILTGSFHWLQMGPWEFMLNIIFVTPPLLDVVGGKCTSFPAINECKTTVWQVMDVWRKCILMVDLCLWAYFQSLLNWHDRGCLQSKPASTRIRLSTWGSA